MKHSPFFVPAKTEKGGKKIGIILNWAMICDGLFVLVVCV